MGIDPCHASALLASVFVFGLAGCSPSSAAEATSGSVEAANSASLSPIPGEARLYTSCTVNAVRVFQDVVLAPGEDGGTFLGTISVMDSASLEVSLAPGDENVVTMSTERWHHWSKGSVTSVAISKTLSGPGGHIVLRDDTILPNKSVTCMASLSPQPTISVVASSDPIALGELTAPRVDVDLFLPNRLSCGLALKLARPVTQKAVDDLADALSVEGPGVVITRDDDHTIAFRVPDAHGWDAFVSLESRDHTTSVADRLRGFLSQAPAPEALGTLEEIPCAAP